MDLLNFAFVAIFVLFVLWIAVSFYSFLARGMRDRALAPVPERIIKISDPPIVEAVQLCQRLSQVERQAFHASRKAGDAEAWRTTKARMERIRCIYEKAFDRLQRRYRTYQQNQTSEK